MLRHSLRLHRKSMQLILCFSLMSALAACDEDPTEGGDTVTDATTSSGNNDGSDAGDTADGGNTTTPPDTTDPDASAPPLTGDTCSGYATRYWDCCKAHCGWEGNADGISPVTSCNRSDEPQTGSYGAMSSCDNPSPDSAYTCFSMRPWSVNDTLAYGFAAVPASGAICGRCYQLEFDGTGHYNASDPGSVSLAGKTMIVQATNIGHDVSGGQFDILIPGGGVGLFDACTNQWGITDSNVLGAQYGGFLSSCQSEVSASDHEAVKTCVRNRCQAAFNNDSFSDAELLAGCEWFIDWYNAADNPNLNYREVECPQAIIDLSGVDRRPLNDIAESCGSSGSGSGSGSSGGAGDGDRGTCECDCSWTDGGANCGDDDGSCCWLECCGDSA